MPRNRIQFRKDLSETRFQALYGDEERCRALVVAWRWPDGFRCPRCSGRSAGCSSAMPAAARRRRWPASVESLQDVEAGTGYERPHIRDGGQMADRRLPRPGHRIVHIAALALQNIVDSKSAVGFQDTRFGIDSVLGCNVHGDVDGHCRIEGSVSDGQARRVTLLESDTRAEPDPGGVRLIPTEELRRAMITLSSFGMIGGRFASQLVVPPQVAVLGVGRFDPMSWSTKTRPCRGACCRCRLPSTTERNGRRGGALPREAGFGHGTTTRPTSCSSTTSKFPPRT